MAVFLRQSTAVDIALGPFLDATDGVTAETALTISQADVRLKKNNGNWAQKNQASSATHEENGWYEASLDATDTNTLGILLVAVNESGALPVWREFLVVPAVVYDALVAGSDNLDVNTVQISGTAQTAGDLAARLPAALVSGRMDSSVGAMANNVLTAAAINANAITSAKVDSTVHAATADAVWDEARAGHTTLGSFGEGVASVAGNVEGDVSGNVIGNVEGEVFGVGSSAITATSFAAGAITAASLAADAGEEIADAVWDEPRAGHVTAGSFGQGVASVQGNVTGSVGSVSGNVGGNVSGSVGSVASGGITSSSFAAGAITSTTLASDTITAAKVATDVATDLRALASGTVDSGSTTAIVDSARTEADADYWKGALILFTSGPAAGQARLITAFDASLDTITWAPATTQAPAAGNTYEILPAGRVDVELWDGAAVNALSSGRVDVSVGAMAANTVTASALATDARDEIVDAVWDEPRASHVTAGSFGEGAASVQGNVTGSVGSVSGNVGGNVGGNVTGSVGSVASGGITAASFAANALSAAALASATANKIADHVLRRALSSTESSSDGDAVGFRSLLGAARKLVNRVAISAGTLTIYKEDDTTSAGSQAVTTDGAAQPIKELDTA